MTKGVKDIDNIFSLQSDSENLQKLKETSVNERLSKIRSIEKYLLEDVNRENFIRALHTDLRKPANESLTNEYVPVILTIAHVKKYLRSWMNDRYVEQPFTMLGFSSFIRYEPKGMVLIIAPWNYPFQLIINPLIYAIAAGNAVVIKPSEFAIATAAFITNMISDLFPANEVAVCEGDVSVASALLEKPFNHIFFTGSPAIGKIVMLAAANNLASVTLELGGKSPVIVDETTNIKVAAEKIAWGKTMNSGQTCIAPDYLLIHESNKEEFIKYYREVLSKFYNRNNTGIENSSNLARIINLKNLERLRTLMDDAVQNGGTILVGGDINEKDLYIAPTLIENVNIHMKIMREEIFGPLLPMITFRTIKEAVDIVNNLPKPLAFYILSNSKKNIEFVLKHTTAGTTGINELMLNTANQYLPFGGVNNSGVGKSNGMYSFSAFSNERGVVKRKWGTLKMLYPPYNNTITRLLIKLSRV